MFSQKRAGPDHPLLNARPNQAAELCKSLGYPTEKSLEDAVNHFDEWIQKQNHFVRKDFEPGYLAAYIIAGKGSIEKAKQRLDKRCTLIKLMPELFSNIKVETEFETLMKCYKHAILPMPTEDFFRITVDKYEANVDGLNILDIGRFQHVTAEYHAVHDLSIGQECIVDLLDVNISDIVTKLNPLILQKIMIMLVEGYGAKIRVIHLISASKFIDTIIGLLKQGISEKMANRIQVHNKRENVANFIDKTLLPSDYGGTLKTLQEHVDDFNREITSAQHQRWIDIAGTYCTDETKRLNGKFNEEYLGMPGSFRTLNVD